MPRHTRFLATTALVAALPTLAVAQDAVLEPIQVTGPDAGDGTGPVEGQANPLTQTGTKTATPLNEIPQSISVVGAEEIAQTGASSISEALRYVPGVTTEVYGNDTDYDWTNIRGFQADQTGIFWDGVQNLAFGFGSLYVDPYTLERIEVLRGPASVLYGGSNPGGVLNYVSKRPGDRVREVTVGVDTAPGGFAAFDFGDQVSGGNAYRLTGRIEGGDKYDDFGDGVRGVLAPSFSFGTDGGTEVTLLANLFAADERHTGYSFLPYFGTVEATPQFGRIGVEDNFSDPDWDSYQRRQATVTAIVDHELDGGWTLSGTGRLGFAEIEERFYYPFGYSGFALQPQDDVGTLSLIAFQHDSTLRTAQSDLRATGSVDLAGVTHELLLGLDARWWELEQTQSSGGGTNTVVGTTDPGTPEIGDPYIDATNAQRQLGVYAQDQMRFGAGWIATVNARYDWVTTETDSNISEANDFERDDAEASYRAGLAYEFANGVTPYASIATFFLPTIASPAEGVTEPESGDQIEAGVKWASVDGSALITAAVFRIDRENVVTGVAPNLDQRGEVRSDGVELEGQYDFGNGLTTRASATFLDLEVTEDADPALEGKTLPLIPQRRASLRADYAFAGQLEGLRLGGGIRYQGESQADPANTREVDAATLYDAFAGYAWQDWSVDLAVTNLADDRYVTGCADLYTCSYGEGRQARLSLTRRW